MVAIISFLSVLPFVLLSIKPARFSKKRDISTQNSKKISIVVPARNEESNIDKLLTSIANQTKKAHEVVVVDDESDDNTAALAKESGSSVISTSGLNRTNFLPKPFACHLGFNQTSGDVVLFLDSDTWLAPQFLEQLAYCFRDSNRKCVSFQPFHRMKYLIEELSLFFQIASLVGSGLFSLVNFRVGIFGPCIAMTREAYEDSGGFANENVRGSFIEDVELGKCLNRESVDIQRFLGTGMIEYRMYSRFAELFQGWTKNISRGATQVPVLGMISIIIFFGYLLSSTFEIPVRTISLPSSVLFLSIWFYLLLISRRIGNYIFGVLFFPVPLMFFILVFFTSSVKRILGYKTQWKGRSLSRIEE